MSAKVSKTDLRKEINLILKDADLTSTSSKAVRLQLEKKLKVNLLDRKKEVDELVMEFVNGKEENGEKDSEDSGEESEEEAPKKAAKRPAHTIKKPAPTIKKVLPKKQVTSADESGSDGVPSDEEKFNDNDHEVDSDDSAPKKRKAAPKSKKGRSRKKNSDDETGSDGDWKQPKKKKVAGKGFNRPYKLSPELSSLMGADSLPRHEVVKKMWAIIKERNLADPKNKQFAVCDAEMLKVMGVKRFRTFGMMKYLKTHFITS